MSSIKGAEAVEELNEERPKSGVRLSTLNPQVREKLIKFDTANDGELSLEEAIQGLVTLQKQSNNYKRMLYILIPLMTVMLACVLGVNILAIQLTKDLEASTTTGNPVLTNKAGNVLATSTYTKTEGMLDWLIYGSYDNIDTINIDTLSLKVDSMYLQKEETVNTLYFSTPVLWFSLSSNGTYKIEQVSGGYRELVYNLVENELKNIQGELLSPGSKNMKFPSFLSLFTVSTSKPPPPAASVPFGCGVVPTKCVK